MEKGTDYIVITELPLRHQHSLRDWLKGVALPLIEKEGGQKNQCCPKWVYDKWMEWHKKGWVGTTRKEEKLNNLIKKIKKRNNHQSPRSLLYHKTTLTAEALIYMNEPSFKRDPVAKPLRLRNRPNPANQQSKIRVGIASLRSP